MTCKLSKGTTSFQSSSSFRRALRDDVEAWGSQLTIRVTGVDHTGKQAEIAETVVVGEQA